MNSDKEKEKLQDELEKFRNENSQLLQKLASLESIVEESSVAILIGDTKGRVIDANKKALELTLYSHTELCTKKINDILIKEGIPESFNYKNSKEPSDEFNSEEILVRKNSKKIYVTVHTKLMSDNRYEIIINNIHQRKKAELALFESEKRYRLLAENIHDVVWTTSKNLKIQYISSSIHKITEFNPDVYYQKPLHEIVTPISYRLIRETLRKEVELWKTGATKEPIKHTVLEIKLIHKRQKSVWVELTATALNDQRGKPIGFQGVIRNIDAQKKAQEAIAKNMQKYEFALRSTESGIWELDADLTRINIDNNLLSILGYTKDEIKPQLNDWINLTIKKDRRNIIDILQDLLDGKKVTMSYECRRIHKSGEIIWFSDYVEAIPDKTGKVVELIGTSKNINREKITEEKKYRYYAGLQKLIDSTFHLLKLPDIDSIFDYAGKVLLQCVPNSILIFCKVDQTLKMLKPLKFAGVNEPLLYQQIAETNYIPYQSALDLPQKEFNLLEKKILIEYRGGFKAFISSIFPKNDAEHINGMFDFGNLYMIGITHDEELTYSIIIINRDKPEIQNKEFIEAFINLTSIIINRKNIEMELKNLNITKDKFFSIISHDLKNPFNTFIGFSGLIMQNIETISKDKIYEFSEYIHDGALQSYEMMQNLFDWVSGQRGTIKVSKVKINLPDLINSIFKLFSSEAIKKDISLKLLSSTEIEFHSDIDILNTIFRNLVSNALKFTNKGGEITISYQKADNGLQFNIIDTGVGISKEKQAQLFNVHTNKSSLGTEHEKGTGLGLVLCKEFTELLNGEIWVESEEGKGSCFFLTIP